MIPVLVTMPSKPISSATERPWVSTETDRSQRARRRTSFWRRGTVSTLWLRMSGWASTTVRMSAGRPFRSLMRTSMLVPGFCEPNLADRLGDHPRAAVGQVIAGDHRDDDVLEPHLVRRLGDAARLVARR